MNSPQLDPDRHDHHPHPPNDTDQIQIQLDNGSCPPRQSKSPVGFGLKKWRRFPRNLPAENPSPASAPDSGKAHKRVLPPIANPAKAHHHASDALSSSLLPADSDNSSKSSTAASAPAPKIRPKPLAAAKPSGTPSLRVSQGKGKKPRGGRFEKENSQSSIESDSRSSNLFFMSGANATSNGNGNGKQSASYDGENSDDATASDQEDAQSGDDKENAGDLDDSQDGSAAEVSWGLKDAKSENSKFGFGTVRDPLVESIRYLQSVQEELVKEVQKLGEIGNEPVLTLEKLMESDSANGGTQGQNPCSPSGSSDKTTETDESSLRATIVSLEQTVKLLESKLDEATTLIVEKESKVTELEASINSTKSPKKEDSVSTVELQGNDDHVEMMADELEAIFKQRIEAEIEYLTITRATENVKIIAGKQVKLFEELESVAEGQAEMLNKLGETESKAVKLKKEAQELEKYRSGILETEEVLASQRRVYKVTWCFCTQLILLLFVVWIFVSQLSSDPGAVVPT